VNELGSLYAGQVPQACKKPRERPPRALFLSLSPESRQPLRTLLRRVATPLAALVARGKASTRLAPLTDHRRSKVSNPRT